jgi:hypothetical protein
MRLIYLWRYREFFLALRLMQSVVLGIDDPLDANYRRVRRPDDLGS